MSDSEEEKRSEDFESEEESEDEEERRRKKKKKKFTFIADEAEEDDEDDEEEEEGEEGFSEEQANFISREEDSGMGREHRRLDVRAFREASEKELMEKAKHYDEIYSDYYTKPSYASRKFRGDMDFDNITPAALQPTALDPKLWLIKCRMGSERALALSLMRKYFEKADSAEPLQIASVVTHDHLKGYIYIEATKKAHVQHAIDKMTTVFASKITLVELNEMVDVLTVRKKEVKKLKVNSWVRFKRGKYEGDLGQIVSVDDHGDSVIVKCIPRIDPVAFLEEKEGKREKLKDEDGDKDEDEEGKDGKSKGKRKRDKNAERPKPRLLTRLLEEFKDLNNYVISKSRKDVVEFNNERYKNGYLQKQWKIRNLITENVTPTLDELQLFRSDEGNNLDYSTMVSDLGQSEQKIEFRKGDVVQVNEGDLESLIGTIQSIEGETVTILPKLVELKDLLRFQWRQLKKYFELGDHVKVVAGKHEGKTGTIVKIQDNIVTIFLDLIKEGIEVFAKDVQKTDEVSSGLGGVGNYVLYDFVNLDAQSYGVIVRVEKDSFRVLDQNGSVRTIKEQEITSKRVSKHAIAQDAHRNSIKQGDLVTILQGPNQNKQAKILFIYRSTAFLHSNDILENAGVVVSLTKNVALVGSQKINNDRNQFAMPAPRIAQNRKKSELISKIVQIVKGTFKGYKGTVTNVADDIAHIELHSRPKPVSINIRDIKVLDSRNRPAQNGYGSQTPGYDGRRTPGYDGGRTPGYDGGSRTPGYEGGSRTPGYDSGSRTPGYDGRTPSYPQTPSYGGRTPAWEPSSRTPAYDGSRTPAWDAGSKTPSYHSWNSESSSSYTPATPGGYGTPSTPHGETPYNEHSTGQTPRETGYTPNELPPTPHEQPDTPATPYGVSYSHGIPQTPGNIPHTPRTPATPSTPYSGDTHYDEDDEEETWVSQGLEVRDRSTNQQGVIKSINNGNCLLSVESGGAPITVPISNLEPVMPGKNDSAKVLRGDLKDSIGTLLNIDGLDGIIKIKSDLHILLLKNLCKSQPI